MKIREIYESTTAGSIAPTEHAFVKMQTRSPSVYGDQKVGSLLKGKKTNKPFVNSLNEGAMNQLSMDLKGGVDGLSDEEFQKKYKMSKQEARKELTANRKENKKPEKVNEADLQEDDIIVVPGQGRIKKTGFTKHDPDKAEHEGQTLKNSLHTIIRVATALDKELSTRDNFPEWVSEKIGAVKSNMVTVMDYLISAKEMQHDPDAMDENKIDFAKKLQKNIAKTNKAIVKTKREIGSRISDIGAGGKEHNVKTDKAWDDAHKVKEGAKVDRMVKHVAQSEKKLGHGKKEAENIAWATANKRGMLNNKNKKA
jgi:hypothetical protein